MAEFQTTIELKAVTNQLNRQLKKVKQDLKGVSNQVKKTEGSFKQFGNKASGSISKLNKKLKEHRGAIAGIAVAVAALAGKGISDFKKFEDGMAQIATLGVKGLKDVEKQLDSVRRQFGITGKEATKGYYDIISAGAKDEAEALNRLTAATKLAKAGNTDLAKAVDILTGGLNVWKEAGISAAEITDKLFLGVKFGKTTVEELGQTFGMVAPMVEAAGGSFDDYAASMATLTAGGMMTNTATTGLKGMMVAITKSTAKQDKEVKRLNISWGVSAVKAKGMTGMLGDLKKAIDADTSGAAQITILNRLIDNSEAAAAMDVMLKNYDKFVDINKKMANAQGTTANALEKVKKTASFQLGRFNQQLSIMSKNVGASVVPALLSIVDVLSPIVEMFSNLIASHPGIVKVTVAVTALATSLAFLGGPVTLGIVALGGALFGIAKHFDAFETSGTVAFNRINMSYHNFVSGFKKTPLGGYLKKIADGIKKAFNSIHTFFEEPIDKATKAVEKAFAWLWKELLGESWIPDIVNGIKNWVNKLWGWFVDPIEKMTSKVNESFAGVDGPQAPGAADVAGDVAGLAVAKPIIEALIVLVDRLREGMVKLGLAVERPIVGLSKLGNISFGSVKAEMQGLIQKSRELEAAISDDKGKIVSTDKATSARALENATKLEESIRKARIASLRTLGPELLKIQLGIVDAQLAQLNASTGGKALPERGIIGRFFFGKEGTMLTWTEKMKGFMTRIGGLFDKLSNKVINLSDKMGKALQETQAKAIKQADDAIKIQKDTIALQKKQVLAAKANSNPSQKGAKPKIALGKAGAQLQDSLDKMKRLLASRAELVSKTLVRTEAINKAQALISELESKWVKLTEEIKIRKERGLDISKLLAKEQTLVNNMIKAEASLLKAETGKITKSLKIIVKLISGSGTLFKVLAVESSKLIKGLATIVGAIARSKVVAGLTSSVKHISSISGVSKALGILGAIAKKILIPILAVVDFYKGFTDLDRVKAVLGENKETFSNAEKTLSGVSNAVGNFLSGFAHLGAMVSKHFGGDVLAKYLKSVDVAPYVAKVFKTIGTVLQTIFNVIGAVFSGSDGKDESGDESGFTKIIKQVGAILAGIVDFFSDISKGLLLLSEGKGSEGVDKISAAVSELFSVLVGALKTVLVVIGAKIAEVVTKVAKDIYASVKGMFMEIVDGINNFMSDLWKDIKSSLPFGGEVDLETQKATSLEDLNAAVKRLEHAKEYGRTTKALEQVVLDLGKKVNDLNLQTPVKKASGGSISGPGTGTSDSIPAMLSDGEFIVNAKDALKNKSLLESINNGGKIRKFAEGGSAGKPGTIGSVGSVQFLQFTDGKFDYAKNMELFVNHLKKGSEGASDLANMMQAYKDSSSNLNEEEALRYEYTQDLNRAILKLNPAKEEEHTVTKGAVGSILALDEATSNLSKKWDNIGKEFSGPIKQALVEGDSIGDAMKLGLSNMFKKAANNSLDTLFAPLEASLTKGMTDLFSSPDLTSSMTSLFSDLFSGSGGWMDGLMSIFGFSKGGIVPKPGQRPQYFSAGGFVSKGTDTVPAMLTPGEVVLNKGQQNALGASNTINQTINISGNVDDRAIQQIQAVTKQVLHKEHSLVANAAQVGQRRNTGLNSRR